VIGSCGGYTPYITWIGRETQLSVILVIGTMKIMDGRGPISILMNCVSIDEF
jgi:hypothetical protein